MKHKQTPFLFTSMLLAMYRDICGTFPRAGIAGAYILHHDKKDTAEIWCPS